MGTFKESFDGKLRDLLSPTVTLEKQLEKIGDLLHGPLLYLAEMDVTETPTRRAVPSQTLSK